VSNIFVVTLTVDRGESVDGIVELLQSVRQVLRGCAILKLKRKKKDIIKHHFILSVVFIVAKRILYYSNCFLVLPHYMLCFYRH
jgi:hypothetical protein